MEKDHSPTKEQEPKQDKIEDKEDKGEKEEEKETATKEKEKEEEKDEGKEGKEEDEEDNNDKDESAASDSNDEDPKEIFENGGGKKINDPLHIASGLTMDELNQNVVIDKENMLRGDAIVGIVFNGGDKKKYLENIIREEEIKLFGKSNDKSEGNLRALVKFYSVQLIGESK